MCSCEYYGAMAFGGIPESYQMAFFCVGAMDCHFGVVDE
jgi:hypothetical protein